MRGVYSCYRHSILSQSNISNSQAVPWVLRRHCCWEHGSKLIGMETEWEKLLKWRWQERSLRPWRSGRDTLRTKHRVPVCSRLKSRQPSGRTQNLSWKWQRCNNVLGKLSIECGGWTDGRSKYNQWVQEVMWSCACWWSAPFPSLSCITSQ